MQFDQSEFKISETINVRVKRIITTDNKHRVEVHGNTHATVYADRHQLEQIIINFLSNAVKYSPYAELIKIRLSTNKKFIKVEICDFGIGIAQDKSHHGFDPFFRW